MNRSPARTIARSSTLVALLVAATPPTAGRNLPDWSRKRIEILAGEKRLVVSRDLNPGPTPTPAQGEMTGETTGFPR